MRRPAASWALDALLAAVLGSLALWLRVLSLPVRFPYNDDLMQLHIVTRPSLGAFGRALVQLWPMPPPLDYFLGFLAARTTQELETLRLVPVAYGTLTVLAAYAFGRRLHGRSFGWWWALLLAVSMPLISFSQTLRPYSLTVLLALASCYAYHTATAGGAAWRYAAAAAAFQAAYPHAAIFAACQWLTAARTGRGRTAKCLIPSLLVFMAWLASWHWAVDPGGTPAYRISPADIVLIASVFNQGSGPVAVLYAPLALLGCWAALRSRPRELTLALTLLGLGLPAIVFLHVIARGQLAPRHAIALLPVYLGLVAAGVTAAGTILQEMLVKRNPAAAALTAPVLTTCLVLASLGPIGKLYQRESLLTGAFRQTLETLRRDAQPGEAVVFSNPNTGAAVIWALDRSAFGRIDGLKMANGFAVFRFPKELLAHWGSAAPKTLEAALPRVTPRSAHPAYTLCSLDPALATAAALGPEQASAWWVHLEGINFRSEPNPFPAALGLPRDQFVEAAPGLFRLARSGPRQTVPVVLAP